MTKVGTRSQINSKKQGPSDQRKQGRDSTGHTTQSPDNSAEQDHPQVSAMTNEFVTRKPPFTKMGRVGKRKTWIGEILEEECFQEGAKSFKGVWKRRISCSEALRGRQ